MNSPTRPRSTTPSTAPRRGVLDRSARLLAVLLVLFGCLGLLACGPDEEADTADAEPAGERVEVAELDLALDPLPSAFEVVDGDAPLVLEATDREHPGTVTVRSRDYGHQNLNDAVWSHKDAVEAAPQGRYMGQNELGGVALGTTYVSRGEMEGADGELIEQYRALALHPTRSEILEIDYEYTAGDDEDRLDDLMSVLAAVVPLDGEGGGAAPAGTMDDEGDAMEGGDAGAEMEEMEMEGTEDDATDG